MTDSEKNDLNFFKELDEFNIYYENDNNDDYIIKIIISGKLHHGVVSYSKKNGSSE